MWPFGRKQSSTPESLAAASPQSPPPQPPPPPPPPVHFGVPYAAGCVAVDQVQGTIAVGAKGGDVKLFGRGAAEMLLPAGEAKQAAVHLVFYTNGGRLLVVHLPGLLRLWDLTGADPRLAASFSLGSAAIEIVWAVPRSPYALLGLAGGLVRACDMRANAAAAGMAAGVSS